MTYLEKFIEVFGYEPSRDLCNTMDCKTVGCSECRYNGKDWGDEYNEHKTQKKKVLPVSEETKERFQEALRQIRRESENI